MAFYQTYRPQTFSEIVGQEYITQILKNSIKQNKISHAYLFTGPRGTGKTSVARILAKAVNCSNRKENHCEPCNKCVNCVAINENKAMDLMEIDAASNRGIDEIRSLRDKVNYAPSQLKYKVYVIDEVHMLTNEAFNALLKTLEEPPAFTLFILATTEPHKVLDTVISRCIRFDFCRLAVSKIVEQLKKIASKEKFKIETNALHLIAKQSQGGLRDAIGILDQLHAYADSVSFENAQVILGLTDVNAIESYLDALLSLGKEKLLEVVNETAQRGYDLKQFTDGIIEYLRQLLLYKITAKAALVNFSPDETEKAKKYCEKWTINQLITLSNIFLGTKNQFSTSPLPELPLELSGLKAIEILQKAEDLEVLADFKEKPFYSKKSTNEISETAQKTVLSAKTFTVKEKPQEATIEKGIKSEASVEEKKPAKNSLSSTSLLFNALTAKWLLILQKLRQHNHSLEALLRSCEPIEVVGNTITLAVKFNFHKSKLSEESNKLILENVFSEVLGNALRVSIIVRENVTPLSATLQAKGNEKLAEKVKEAIKIFGGGKVIS